MVPQASELDEVETEGRGLEDFESLRIALQHRVFDPVVDHLGVVPGPGRAHVGVSLGGRERLEDRLDLFEDGLVAAHHQVEAHLEAPDASADTGIEKFQLLRSQRFRAADRIFVIRVAAIHDHVPGREHPGQSLDGVIDRWAGGDHQPEDARWLELLTEIFEARATDGAIARDRGARLWRPVIDHQLVPALHQSPGHSRSHAPEPDQAELHQPTRTVATDWAILARPCATSAI